MKVKHQILLHSVIWVIFLGLPILSTLLGNKQSPGMTAYLTTYGVINVMNFYTSYLIVSGLLGKKKRSLNLLWLLLPVAILFTFLRIVTNYMTEQYFPEPDQKEIQWVTVIIIGFVNVLVYTVMALLVSFFVGWINVQRQKEELIRQSREAEVALLKSQINPHFLFNTLNNLYSLVSRKSDQAPDALMKLSDILRYMLYDCNEDKVLLLKEISYLKSYIELQQLRLTKPEFIRFEIIGEPGGILVPPMLLINFVENAFKHGNKNVDSPGIRIKMESSEDEFNFHIVNYINENEVVNKDPERGIGLKNIRRRLDLGYAGKYFLENKKEGDRYIVNFKLKLL